MFSYGFYTAFHTDFIRHHEKECRDARSIKTIEVANKKGKKIQSAICQFCSISIIRDTAKIKKRSEILRRIKGHEAHCWKNRDRSDATDRCKLCDKDPISKTCVDRLAAIKNHMKKCAAKKTGATGSAE